MFKIHEFFGRIFIADESRGTSGNNTVRENSNSTLNFYFLKPDLTFQSTFVFGRLMMI
jgi:hypothetical protein